MGYKKRQLMVLPEVNPSSFVLFFEKGDTGLSWSIHDYSEKGPFKLLRRSDFGWTAQEVRQKATHSFDAPTVAVDEFEYWHELTCEMNRTHLGSPGAIASRHSGSSEPNRGRDPEQLIEQFLDLGDGIYTKKDLAQRASIYKRKIDGSGVSAASITRICQCEVVGRLIREAVASVINTKIPCTADDLLPDQDPSVNG